jgi:hypothetical protein
VFSSTSHAYFQQPKMPELCDLCRSIKLRPPALPSQPIGLDYLHKSAQQAHSAQFYDHYPNFLRLLESAKDGCPLCVLLVQSLLNADILVDWGPGCWGGIILVWYRTSIDLEYQSSTRRFLNTKVDHVTEKCPGQWDKLDVLVQNPVCLGPGQVLSAHTLPGVYNLLIGNIESNEYRESSSSTHNWPTPV